MAIDVWRPQIEQRKELALYLTAVRIVFTLSSDSREPELLCDPIMQGVAGSFLPLTLPRPHFACSIHQQISVVLRIARPTAKDETSTHNVRSRNRTELPTGTQGFSCAAPDKLSSDVLFRLIPTFWRWIFSRHKS